MNNIANAVALSLIPSPFGPVPAVCLPGRGRRAVDYAPNNLAAYETDPAQYFADIVDAARGALGFVWHPSGDIPGADYLRGMCDAAERAPYTRFITMTERADLVADYINRGGYVPRNLRVYLIRRGEPVANPHGLPVVYPLQYAPPGVDVVAADSGRFWGLRPGDSVAIG